MKIGVIGGGAWGTALAQVAAHGGEPVVLWAREPEVVDSINRTRVNALFLNDIPLSPSIRATGDIWQLHELDAILVVAPAQHVAAVLAEAPVAGRPLVLCAKGIEAAPADWSARSPAPSTRPRRSPSSPARPSPTRSPAACPPPSPSPARTPTSAPRSPPASPPRTSALTPRPT